jgi:hypothetical protein
MPVPKFKTALLGGFLYPGQFLKSNAMALPTITFAKTGDEGYHDKIFSRARMSGWSSLGGDGGGGAL